MDERTQDPGRADHSSVLPGVRCGRVVCWVDSTAQPDQIVRVARALARPSAGQCQVVMCLDAACPEPGSRPSPLTPERIGQTECQLADLYGAGVSTLVLPGHPVAEIRRFALNNRVDLIVMGEQGLALERLYGQRLLEDPPCPVMVLAWPRPAAAKKQTDRVASKRRNQQEK